MTISATASRSTRRPDDRRARTAPVGRRARARAGAVALGAAGALVASLAGTAAPAHAATPGIVYRASTVAQIKADVDVLKAGDSVLVAPGTYDMGRGETGGVWRPRLGTFGHRALGTPTAPIVFTAADPAHAPLLTGSIKLDGANYWRLSHLRVQGTVRTTDTLTFNGGTGWSLTDSEVFGARATGALANVVVSKVTFGMPTNWTIAHDAIHDGGAVAAKAGMQHEIYLTAVGNAGHAVIRNNALYNTSEGAAVKIGNGGLANAPGISGVSVVNNTMYANFEQVVLHGAVSNNLIQRNLMVLSTRRQGNGNTVGVYVHQLAGANNVIRDNYLSAVTTPIYASPGSSGFRDGGGNIRSVDPRFDHVLAWSFHPGTAAARAYGRWAH